MIWEELKQEAKKMGYNEDPGFVNGIVWLTKNNGDFYLCFNNEGMVLLDGDEEYILAKDRTPDQIFAMIKALHQEVK